MSDTPPPTWNRRPIAGGARARDFHLRLPPDLDTALRAAALARGLPAAAYVRQLIADAVAAHTGGT